LFTNVLGSFHCVFLFGMQVCSFSTIVVYVRQQNTCL